MKYGINGIAFSLNFVLLRYSKQQLMNGRLAWRKVLEFIYWKTLNIVDILIFIPVTGADSQGHQIFPPFHVKEFVQMANPTAFRCSLSEYFENIIGYNQNDKDSKGTPDGKL
jgi:hypothetical protein